MAGFDIPPELIWVLLLAVIVQGFSMALLVYLMFRMAKKKSKAEEEKVRPSPEEKFKKET